MVITGGTDVARSCWEMIVVGNDFRGIVKVKNRFTRVK